MTLRLLGTSLGGTLLEYGLLPHLTDKISTQAARDHAKSMGGVVVHAYSADAPVRSALTSTLQTVGHVLHGVKDMVGPGGGSGGRGSTSPFDSSGGASGAGQQTEGRENFSVLCLALRWWDLCRRRGWSATAGGGGVGGGVGRAGESGETATERGRTATGVEPHSWERSFGYEGSPSAARRLAWLSQVDMATYAVRALHA